jgi:hypothetical protein
MDRCFKCGRAGHWAAACDSQPCGKCRVRLDWHTGAGLIECAWRGHPCLSCGHPPHPDYADGRCDRYTHPSDTPADRDIRLRTAWLRDNVLPCYQPASFRARGITYAG